MDKRFLSGLLVVMAIATAVFAGCTGTAGGDIPAAEQTPAVSEKTVYKVGIDVPYPPFSMIDTSGKATGFDVESIEWIAEDQGIEIEFKQVAWDGIIPALQAGTIDMIYSGMTITDERAEKVNFSIPYWTVNQALVAKSDSDATLEMLNEGKLSVGTQAGCTAEIWMDENLVQKEIMPNDNLKRYPTIGNAIDDLKTGRIDAVMYDSTVINDVISEDDPIKNIGYIETNEQFGIAVRKDDPQLLAKLNAGLDNLMTSQDWQDLITKYKMK